MTEPVHFAFAHTIKRETIELEIDSTVTGAKKPELVL